MPVGAVKRFVEFFDLRHSREQCNRKQHSSAVLGPIMGACDLFW